MKKTMDCDQCGGEMKPTGLYRRRREGSSDYEYHVKLPDGSIAMCNENRVLMTPMVFLDCRANRELGLI